MKRRPSYTLDQIVDLFSLDLPMVRKKDLKLLRKTWRLYLGYDSEKKRTVQLYAPGRLTRDEAWERLNPQILRYLQGRLPAMIRVEGWSEKWLSTLTCKESTKANYRSMLKLHIRPKFGDVKLKDLTPSLIRQHLCEQQAKEKLSVKSINEQLVLMRAMFQAAVDDDLLQKNPCAGISKIAQQKPTVEAFTEEEVQTILKTAREQFPRWHVPILHAVLTGQRAGEIWAQRWEDLGDEAIRVEKSVRAGILGPLKDYESRNVEFPRSLAQAIREATVYHSTLRGPWLYTSEHGGRVCHDNFAKRVWKPLVKAAKVRSLCFHTLRHTFASLHLRHGTGPEWISKQLGHFSTEFTIRTYCHFLPKKDDNASNRLAKAIGL